MTGDRSRESYLLAQASEGDVPSLKACIAATALEIPLAAACSKAKGLIDMLHGPALLDGSGSGVAFGGNGILIFYVNVTVNVYILQKCEMWKSTVTPSITSQVMFLML